MLSHVSAPAVEDTAADPAAVYVPDVHTDVFHISKVKVCPENSGRYWK
jgi:hypothetical protein